MSSKSRRLSRRCASWSRMSSDGGGANHLPPRIEMNEGPLIIVSGPSGSGKSTLIRRVLPLFAGRLRHSISATTREQRDGEEDGVEYHFWTRDRFQRGIAAGEFLEYATV